MRNGHSVKWVGELLAFWGSGAVTSSSDSDLLAQFTGRRGPSSDVALEALLVRHGPMVLGTCRRVLRDRHDVEDAFQATFLVFIKKAHSLRVKDSLGPWLHQVARRVSLEARTLSNRRREREGSPADFAAIPGRAAREDDLKAVIDEEIGRLPEGFRKAVILCDLEGFTIEEAASHLGCPTGTIRSRLARGRDRLRDRLARRGMAPSEGIVPMVGDSSASLPASLIKTMIRCAADGPNFGAVSALASTLCQGVLATMFHRKLMMVAFVATLLGVVGIGTLAALGQRPDPAEAKTLPVGTQSVNTGPQVKVDDRKPAIGYRLVGSVKVEGSDEPVPNARINVLIGDSVEDRMRVSTTATDGRFHLDLPPGQASAWTFFPPVGYWAPKNRKSIERFVLSPTDPVHQKDYLVRRGIVWSFRIVTGGSGQPVRAGFVTAARPPDETFRAETDDVGLARLTLPTEGGKITVGISESPPSGNIVELPIEWASGFRPDSIRGIERKEGLFRLSDEAGRLATIKDVAGVEPTLTGGVLTVRVTLAETDPKTLSNLTGRVVDTEGRPIAGAHIALKIHEKGASGASNDERHKATTDGGGRYVLRSIPLQGPRGDPLRFGVVATKEGYAGVDAPPIPIRPVDDGSPQVVDDIRLEKGVSLRGVVLDPEGSPAIGAWVSPGDSYAQRGEFTRTDENGRFTVRNLPKGMVRLSITLGDLGEGGKYLADGTEDEIKIKLRPFPAAGAKTEAPVRPPLPAIGQPAPELKVVGWTDGKSHSLADYRGKVVYLDFWGIWCAPCIQELPSLMRLKQKFEPRGVVFLSIHSSGENMEQIRRLLELKKAPLISALDEQRKGSDTPRDGETARRYGIYGYPTMMLIDRQGKLAWNAADNVSEKIAEMKALGKEMGIDEATMTVEQFDRLREAAFSREIEKLLDRR
jgi:RNA polymerase sigma factor (sigma-70 family)